MLNSYKIFYLLVFFTLFPGTSNVYSKSMPYVSPGIRIGWDFGRGPTFSIKLSIGVNTEFYSDKHFNFYHITFGFKTPLFRKVKYSYEIYNYLQLQTGLTLIPGNGPLFGGGAGFMFYQDDHGKKYRPMITIDSGFLIFTGFDFILLENKTLSADFGFLSVFPFALRKMDPIFDSS